MALVKAFKSISTHILTKRMTTAIFNEWFDGIISTHILTKRMTLCNRTRRRILYFNSHPHEEDDGIEKVKAFPTKKFQLTSSRRG